MGFRNIIWRVSYMYHGPVPRVRNLAASTGILNQQIVSVSRLRLRLHSAVPVPTPA